MFKFRVNSNSQNILTSLLHRGETTSTYCSASLCSYFDSTWFLGFVLAFCKGELTVHQETVGSLLCSPFFFFSQEKKKQPQTTLSVHLEPYTSVRVCVIQVYQRRRHLPFTFIAKMVLVLQGKNIQQHSYFIVWNGILIPENN